MNIKKSILYHGFKQGIARKLIVYLLVFSSFVTLILTSIQLYIEYTRDIQQIENRLELIEKSQLDAISTGLWSFDETLLEVLLKGILQIPDIQYLEIRPNVGKSLSAGILKKSNIKRKEFKLSFLQKDKKNPVGILLVDVNLGGVYKRLINRVVIILLSQLIKTFLVSSFIFFIFYHLVGKHIISMASFFESIHFESMDQPLQLDRNPKTKKPNELDQLVTSFNRMKDNLARDILRREIAEKELSASEYRLFTHLQNTPVGALSWDLNFKATEWNPAAEAMFGYSKAEAMGKHVTELILPEDLKEMVDGVYRDLISGKGGIRSINENITKDGRRIICDWHNTLLKDADGKVIGAASLVQDITESRKAEETLKKTQQLLTETEKVGKVGGWEFNIDTEKMTWTKETYNIHEIDPTDDLTVTKSINFFSPASKPIIVQAVQRAINHGEPFDLELEIITAKGNLRSVHAVGKVDLEHHRVHGFLQDITIRKMLQEEAEKNKTILLEAEKLAGFGGWEWDIENNSWTLSQNWLKIHGCSNKHLTTEELIKIAHPDDIPKIQKAFDRVVKEGGIYNIEHRIIDQTTGVLKNIQAHGEARLDDSGKAVQIFGAAQEITDKKKLETKLRQAQKMESIGNLAGGIAHDFNNILSSIIGFTELTLDEIEKGSLVEDNLQEVYSAGKRAKDLVKQILTFARQSDDEIKPIQPNLIAKEVIQFVRSSIPTTIEIKQKIESNSLILGNATQLHQIFMNLCTNAAHAMEDEGGILEMVVRDIRVDTLINLKTPELKPGLYIEIVVSDTGSGIEPGIIGNIFEPYFTTKNREKGLEWALLWFTA